VSFDSIERSVQDSVTAELYELVGPAQTYRITSFGTGRDVRRPRVHRDDRGS
jgi:hypothetical protein